MFYPFLLLFVSISVFAVEKRSGWYCTSIRHRPCYPYGNSFLCGTNNYTYYNRCEYLKDHCLDSQIHIAHNGSCSHGSHGANLTHGEEILLEFMCNEITGHRCEEEYDPVCGSNNVTYLNECEYEQVRCMHHELKLVHRGKCL